MSDWKHAGPGGSIVDTVIDTLTGGLLGTKETVRNERTGEYRKVYVDHGQPVGEAIERGQFIDKDRNK